MSTAARMQKKNMTAKASQEQTNVDYAGQVGAIRKSQAVIEFNMDGTIIDAKDNFLKALGYTLDAGKPTHHSMLAYAANPPSWDYRAFWARRHRRGYRAEGSPRIGTGGKEGWIEASY